MLVKWHETFLGLIQCPNPQGRSHGTRVYAKEGSRAKISWHCRPDPTGAGAFYNARMRAALFVRASANRPLLKMLKTGGSAIRS
jgi:hypothetical protein